MWHPPKTAPRGGCASSWQLCSEGHEPIFQERTLRLRCAASESKAGVPSAPNSLALFPPLSLLSSQSPGVTSCALKGRLTPGSSWSFVLDDCT